MNTKSIGLRIPIYHADNCDLIDLPMPDIDKPTDRWAFGFATTGFLVTITSVTGFIVTVAIMSHFAETNDYAYAWPLFILAIGFLLMMGICLNIDETRIRHIVRKLDTVEREVVIGDDFDGLRIVTGTITTAIETNLYIVMHTASRNGKSFAYVAPKLEMTDEEVDRLRRVLEACVRDCRVMGF